MRFAFNRGLANTGCTSLCEAAMIPTLPLQPNLKSSTKCAYYNLRTAVAQITHN